MLGLVRASSIGCGELFFYYYLLYSCWVWCAKLNTLRSFFFIYNNLLSLCSGAARASSIGCGWALFLLLLTLFLGLVRQAQQAALFFFFYHNLLALCSGSGAGKLNRLRGCAFFFLIYFLCAGSGAGKLNRLRPSASTLRVSSIFKRQAAIMHALWQAAIMQRP